LATEKHDESTTSGANTDEPARTGTGSLATEKHARNWFRSKTTIALIDQIKLEYGLEVVHYELAKGTPKQFAGTYVHKYLYQHFLAWLDPCYAIKILKIVDEVQEEANRKLLQSKDDVISKLNRRTKKMKQMISEQTETLNQQTETMAIQTAKIDQLLAFGNKIVGQNDKLQLTVDMTREELSESLNYLVDKSYHSTIDPEDPGKVTHFAILAPDNHTRIGKTLLIRGQIKYINRVINLYKETHVPVVDCTYNANAINLINNARTKYNQMVRKYIYAYNIPIRAANERLKEEIKRHNATLTQMKRKKQSTTMIKRFLSEEKAQLLGLADIAIVFNSTHIWYEPNPHFTYHDVLKNIIDTNELTQKCPINPNANIATDDSSSDDEE
jgi:hypothetical protein